MYVMDFVRHQGITLIMIGSSGIQRFCLFVVTLSFDDYKYPLLKTRFFRLSNVVDSNLSLISSKQRKFIFNCILKDI